MPASASAHTAEVYFTEKRCMHSIQDKLEFADISHVSTQEFAALFLHLINSLKCSNQIWICPVAYGLTV